MGDLFEDRVEGAYSHLMKGQDARYDRSAHQGFAKNIDCPKERRFVGFDACAKVLAAGIDLVILATPPAFRPGQYQAAVAAGKHVFMEKPCCVDAPGFNTLVAANKIADEKNLKVGVGLQRHHQAHYVEAMKRIKDGALGNVQYLRMYWNGFRDLDYPAQARLERYGVSDPQLEHLHVDFRRPYLRAARPQPGRLQLDYGRPSGRGERDGGPAGPHRQG